MANATTVLSGTVPANGILELNLIPDNNRKWIVQQVGIVALGVGDGAVGYINLNGAPVTPFVPTGDAPAGEPYVTLRPGNRLTARWTGATPGATATATFIYDDGTPE